MSEQYDYQVLYIGAGHGTFDGAIPLAASGCKVAIVESGLVGGTCPNRGCNAKITLDEPVKVMREVERLNDVLNGKVELNWTGNVEHKQQVIDSLPSMISGLMDSVGIDVIKGYATFKDSHTVIVNDQEITADKIVISTGLRPHRLDVPGEDLTHDSEDFMNLKSLPRDIVIIGSGYIGMEFATIANAAGSKVTVMLHSDKALRRFHQPFVEKVIADMTKRGVKFIYNAKVAGFSNNGSNISVQYGDSEELTTDWVLDATGRIPNTENMNLEKIGVEYNERGIVINDHLQTTVDNIYASGDVIDSDQPKLTPTAIFESMYLMKLFSGKTTDAINFPVVPSVVFTSPRIAEAGVSIEDAEKAGLSVTNSDLSQDWYYQVDKETLAESKQVHDKDGRLVGITEMSDHADDVINSLLPIIELKLDPEEIGRIVSLFPSIGSAAFGRI
ncbi:dihydrolipoyl dehydrogenase family protein [Companilactobacillus furfuricola]|uniref:dihydrolipoyl dehydrogenase family protein n=1 Tax=Companilactobacillus furfuricola TaxID=1462575 RepID=UPI000F7980B1|nr:NAD(P)/FAD-dependent oxidoreductase [Companilactobacillus furfuricola]